MEESTKLLEEMRRKIAAMPPEKRKQVKARVVPEALKAADVAHNIDAIIKESDDNFKNATALNKKDLAFFALCLGFQVVRQYWLTSFEERLTDKEAAKQTSGHGEEASNRIHRFYHPPIEEIISITRIDVENIIERIGVERGLHTAQTLQSGNGTAQNDRILIHLCEDGTTKGILVFTKEDTASNLAALHPTCHQVVRHKGITAIQNLIQGNFPLAFEIYLGK